jgi:hypothetical protein
LIDGYGRGQSIERKVVQLNRQLLAIAESGNVKAVEFELVVVVFNGG